MTSPYLDLPLFDHPDQAPPSEDYRQLAHRLRELA